MIQTVCEHGNMSMLCPECAREQTAKEILEMLTKADPNGIHTPVEVIQQIRSKYLGETKW